jgi:hypothetical protein
MEVWVTYTALNKGRGRFVDVFAPEGTLVQHFAVHGPLHSPWGVALAPDNFGPMSNAILITNNIPRGRINAFDPDTGAFLGPLRDSSNQRIEIDMFGRCSSAKAPARTAQPTSCSLQRVRTTMPTDCLA